MARNQGVVQVMELCNKLELYTYVPILQLFQRDTFGRFRKEIGNSNDRVLLELLRKYNKKKTTDFVINNFVRRTNPESPGYTALKAYCEREFNAENLEWLNYFLDCKKLAQAGKSMDFMYSVHQGYVLYLSLNAPKQVNISSGDRKKAEYLAKICFGYLPKVPRELPPGRQFLPPVPAAPVAVRVPVPLPTDFGSDSDEDEDDEVPPALPPAPENLFILVDDDYLDDVDQVPTRGRGNALDQVLPIRGRARIISWAGAPAVPGG